MTLRFNADNPKELRHVGRILELGGVVALPTDIAYGVAADASNVEAVKHAYAVLERSVGEPSIIHLGHARQLKDWAVDIPKVAETLVDEHWPGALTLLLHRHPHVSPLVTGGGHSIALRVPAQEQLRELLSKFNLGIIAPSIGDSYCTAQDAHGLLDGKIDGVLDSGECSASAKSTIIDLRGKQPVITREGSVPAASLAELLGTDIPVV
ncbi:L-threonylcarbamoyladenylate synthase [Pseudidiomarina homiensis]|nr:L-threonylcarbamoyladenylate synthase [Pseudidiomarina homiensis]